MDPLEQLERMAINLETDTTDDYRDEPCDADIHRWQRLFNYSYLDAVQHIEQHRSDLSRSRVSCELWDLVKDLPEHKEYDREAYEHKLRITAELPRGPHNPSDVVLLTPKVVRQEDSLFIFKLGGPFERPEDIQKVLESSKPPDVRHGVGEDGVAVFCRVADSEKLRLEQWLAQERVTYRPTFVRESQARKDLLPESIHPTLGKIATLPQYRADHTDAHFTPAQDQYPVWYFFYGTLADTIVLASQLGLSEQITPTLIPSFVEGGVIKSWVGKYKALVDGPATALVHGKAFEVQSAEQEDSLRHYETSRYEVVRCAITLEATRVVMGCTFRFINAVELS